MARFKQDKLVDSIGIAFIWKNHILLTKNPKEKEFEGSLSIPKGRQEEHEIGLPFATALREVKEEIGIEVPLNWIIDKNITDIHLESSKRIRYYIVEIENLSEIGLSDKMIPTDQYQKEEIDFAGFIDFESAKKFIRKDQVNILRDCMHVCGYKSKETIEMTIENENPKVQSIVFGAPRDEYDNNPKVNLNDEELYKDKKYYIFQIFYNHNAILIIFKDKSILEKGNNRNLLEFLDRKGVHIDRSEIKVKEITGLSISNALNKFFIQIDEPTNYEVNEQFGGEFYEVIWKRKYYSPFKIKKKETQELKEGGVIEGQLHSECNNDDGCGEKFTVNQTGKVIEAERDEAVISDDTFRERNLACPVGGCEYRIVGYIPQIASALNVMGGGKSFDPGAEIYELSSNERLTKFESVPKDKNTDVDRQIDSSSIVINRRSMADPNRYEVIGTAKQIASSINSIDGNGKVIETGGIIKKL